MFSVSEVLNDNPIPAPSVKSLNFLPIKSGVIIFRSPSRLVTIERTGTRSSSDPEAIGLSGYTFPFGAVLPSALYLGIKRPGLCVSSPSWYTKLFNKKLSCLVKYPELGLYIYGLELWRGHLE